MVMVAHDGGFLRCGAGLFFGIWVLGSSAGMVMFALGWDGVIEWQEQCWIEAKRCKWRPILLTGTEEMTQLAESGSGRIHEFPSQLFRGFE